MDIYVLCKESVGEGDWVGLGSLVPRPSTAKQLQSNGRIWVRGYCKGKETLGGIQLGEKWRKYQILSYGSNIYWKLFSLHIICRDNLDHFSVSFLLIRESSFIKSAIQRKTVVRKAKSGYIVHCPVPPRPIILKTYLYMCAVTSFADAPSRRWRVRTTRERSLIKILNESGRSQWCTNSGPLPRSVVVVVAAATSHDESNLWPP